MHPRCILVDEDAMDGDATDGDATDGDSKDGDTTDDDATDEEATDEDATDAQHFQMRITPGCASTPDAHHPQYIITGASLEWSGMIPG